MSIKGRIILEILEGMVYLTERRVIHKDLKPENILVDKDFHIKVCITLNLYSLCFTFYIFVKEKDKQKYTCCF